MFSIKAIRFHTKVHIFFCILVLSGASTPHLKSGCIISPLLHLDWLKITPQAYLSNNFTKHLKKKLESPYSFMVIFLRYTFAAIYSLTSLYIVLLLGS